MIRGRFHNDNMGSLALLGPHKKYVGTDVVGRRRINASKFLGGDEWTADVRRGPPKPPAVGGQNESLRCHYFGRGAMLLAARISWRNRVKPLADLTPIPENSRFIRADRR